MTDLMDDYRHLNDWTQVQLLERRTALVGTAPTGDYKQLPDAALQELVAIHRILRRKTTTAKPANTSRKVVPTLDMI